MFVPVFLYYPVRFLQSPAPTTSVTATISELFPSTAHDGGAPALAESSVPAWHLTQQRSGVLTGELTPLRYPGVVS